VIFLVWLVRAVFRPFFAGDIPGSSASGGDPVYGSRGGFFSSLVGGLFGAAAGNWMYDSFRDNNRGSSRGERSSPPSGLGSSEPDPLPADQVGDGDFGRDTDDAGGGGFGNDDSTSGNGGFDDGGGDFGSDSS
jgi:uncharacterized protein